MTRLNHEGHQDSLTLYSTEDGCSRLLAGLPAEAQAATHPCGMQPLMSGIDSSFQV